MYKLIRLRITRGETSYSIKLKFLISVSHEGKEITFLIATEVAAPTAYKSTCKSVLSKVRHEII
jgi:hypothetical protein